jgi:uncharacterized lipoprotein YddW (UPF0748 family)
MKKNIIYTLFFGILFICTANAQSPKQQMRGVWIATVANIDWPSQKNLSTEAQQQEMIVLLDKLKENNINTVIFQVRPSSDAFYESTIEPWSLWLCGTQGLAPDPYYDPLQFVIEQAHKRCMEVHVWINPYRVHNGSDAENLCEKSIYNKQKKWVVKYDGKYFIDPGVPEARDYLTEIVREIVQKYDIEAIHFDDYFYPYPIKGQQFPDWSSYNKNSRGFTSRDDWRRDNVTLAIKQISKAIKEIKPWVDFGISPFGIWRNKDKDPRGSLTKAITNYDDLYADILLWLKEGYIDYVTPQLYWEIGRENVDYKILADWWAANSYGRNLYIGLFASGLSVNKTEAWKKPNELIRQMRYSQPIKEVDGEMFYSAKYFVQNIQGLNDSLKHFYQKPALVPENKNINTVAPQQPQHIKLEKTNNQLILSWDKVTGEGGNQTAFYVVYAFEGKKLGNINDSKNIITFTTENSIDLTEFSEKLSGPYTFTVTTINKYRRESEAIEFEKKKF